MNGKDIELSRRRVLGGIATVGAASAAAGAGTFALFSDSEQSTGNSFAAGTLEINRANSTTLSFSETDIKPTDSDSDSVDLEKSGSVTGDLGIEVTDVRSTNGELDDQLGLTLWVGTNGGGDNDFTSGDDHALLSNGDVSDTLEEDTAASFSGVSWDVITGFNGPVTFNVEWEFLNDENSDTNALAGDADNNDAKGDDVEIDFEFTVEQQTS